MCTHSSSLVPSHRIIQAGRETSPGMSCSVLCCLSHHMITLSPQLLPACICFFASLVDGVSSLLGSVMLHWGLLDMHWAMYCISMTLCFSVKYFMRLVLAVAFKNHQMVCHNLALAYVRLRIHKFRNPRNAWLLKLSNNRHLKSIPLCAIFLPSAICCSRDS